MPCCIFATIDVALIETEAAAGLCSLETAQRIGSLAVPGKICAVEGRRDSRLVVTGAEKACHNLPTAACADHVPDHLPLHLLSQQLPDCAVTTAGLERLSMCFPCGFNQAQQQARYWRTTCGRQGGRRQCSTHSTTRCPRCPWWVPPKS